MMGFLLQICCKKWLGLVGCLTAKSSPVSKDFCQESLTKSMSWVENYVDTLTPLKMPEVGKLGRGLALAGALVATEPALAEGQDNPSVQLATLQTSEQVTDCVAYAQERKALAKQNGQTLSRKQLKSLLLECHGKQLRAHVDKQRKIIAFLDKQIESYKLKIDENGVILDQQGQELARIVTINGKLVLQRQALDQKLADIKAQKEQLNKERQQIATERAEIKIQMVADKAQIAKDKQQIAADKAQIAKDKQIIAAGKAEAAKIETEIKAIEQQTATLRAETDKKVAALQAEAQEIRAQTAQIEAETEAILDEIEAYLIKNS